MCGEFSYELTSSNVSTTLIRACSSTVRLCMGNCVFNVSACTKCGYCSWFLIPNLKIFFAIFFFPCVRVKSHGRTGIIYACNHCILHERGESEDENLSYEERSNLALRFTYLLAQTLRRCSRLELLVSTAAGEV